MTVKEIAVSVGKDERSVRRWINKASDKMSSLSDKMSEADKTKKAAEYTMTVKELAEVMQVSESFIRENVKIMFPEIVRNGIETRLNEYQATELKRKMELNPYLTQVGKVKTDLEMALQLTESANYFKSKYEQSIIENQEKQLRIERLIHNQKTYTSTEIAKELNLKSPQELNGLLEEKGVQYKINGTWTLYAKYSGNDYESIKQEELDNGQIIYNRHWTGKGRDFILDIFNDIRR